MQENETYDLISLEPPPISDAGISSLYSEEFYKLAKSKLKEGGFISQWLPIYQVAGPVGLAFIKAFINVFPQSIIVSGHSRHLILIGRKDLPVNLDLASFKRRMTPSVRKDLHHYFLYPEVNFFSTFVNTAVGLQIATENSNPITDDYPINEYFNLKGDSIDAKVFDVSRLKEWCPTCFEGSEKIDKLEDYQRLLSDIYTNPNFLYRYKDLKMILDNSHDEAIRNIYQQNSYMQSIFYYLK
jgi:spermidine synthase